MNSEEIKKKMEQNSLLSQLDDMIVEAKETPAPEEYDAVVYYQAILNNEVLKFFERERESFLQKSHDPKYDPQGYSAIRDMAVLEYIQSRINLIKQILK